MIKDLHVQYAEKGEVDKKIKEMYDFYHAKVESYLTEYKDKPDNFDSRKERSGINYLNFMYLYQSLIIEYVYKPFLIEREPESNFDFIESSINGGDKSLHEFMADEVSYHLLLAGWVVLVSDRKKFSPESIEKLSKGTLSKLEEEKELGKPYAYCLSPNKIHNYKINYKGELEFIILLDEKRMIDKEEVQTYKYYDSSKIVHYHVKGEDIVELSSSTHKLKENPVKIEFLKKDGQYDFKVGISHYHAIQPIIRKMWNLLCQMDEMILNHLFLKIKIPSEIIKNLKKDDKGRYIVGNTNAFVYDSIVTDETTGQITQVNPQIEYIEVSGKELEFLKGLIFNEYMETLQRFTRIRDKSGVDPESGEAKRRDNEDQDNLFTSIGQTSNRIEKWLWHILSSWDGSPESAGGVTTYPAQYDTSSYNDELEKITKSFENDFVNAEIAKDMLKKLIRKSHHNVPSKELDRQLKSVDKMINPSFGFQDLISLKNMGALSTLDLMKNFLDEEADEYVKNGKKEKDEETKKLSISDNFNGDFDGSKS